MAERLDQALENLLKHAIVSTPEGERFTLTVAQAGDHLEITFRHKVSRLSEDDLEKFFFLISKIGQILRSWISPFPRSSFTGTMERWISIVRTGIF